MARQREWGADRSCLTGEDIAKCPVPDIVANWACAACRAPFPYRHDPDAPANGSAARPEFLLCPRCRPQEGR